jgi:hypothetical protein
MKVNTQCLPRATCGFGAAASEGSGQSDHLTGWYTVIQNIFQKGYIYIYVPSINSSVDIYFQPSFFYNNVSCLFKQVGKMENNL